MRLLCLLAFAVSAIAQNYPVMTLIPVRDATGANTETGELIFRDTGTKSAILAAPLTFTNSYKWRLPLDNTTGCLKNTATGSDGALSIVSCGGLPALDTTIITQEASDPTKQFRLSNALIGAGQTRVATIPNADFTFAGININQTISGVNTFTANQQINQYLDFGYGTFSKSWSLEGQTANVLSFRNSGSVLKMYLEDTGAITPGGGTGLYGPSAFFSSTATGSPTLRAAAIASQTADVFTAYDSSISVKYLAVSPAGAVSASSLSGSGTRCVQVNTSGVFSVFTAGCGGSLPVSDSTVITQDNGDATKQFRLENSGISAGQTRVGTIPNADFTFAGINIAQTFSGVNTFTANQQINQYLDFGYGTFSKSWSLEGQTANVLSFRNSGSVLKMYLEDTGAITPGGGTGLYGPSAFFSSTATGSPTLRAAAIASQTADVLTIYNAGSSVKYFAVSPAGAVSASSLAGSGTRCTYTTNAGVFTLAAGECITTAGGQSIAGTTTLSTLSLSTTLTGNASIAPSGTGSYFDTAFNSGGSYPYRLRGSGLIDNGGVWVSPGGINMNAGIGATSFNIYGGASGVTSTTCSQFTAGICTAP